MNFKIASATKTTYMKKILSLLLLIYSSSLVSATDDGRNTVKANLTTVTVFRIGAEMNHVAKATLVKGNNEIMIAVGNYFYGWGIIARLDDTDDIEIEK